MAPALIWPGLALAAAGLQVVRNAAQRGLTQRLGAWGAAYVRFGFGLPFALAWLAAIGAWRGVSGGPSFEFCAWIVIGASAQAAATGLLVVAMAERAFAVATALSKAEVLGAAALGAAAIGDAISPLAWAGMATASVGVLATAHTRAGAGAGRAALAGIGAGLLFAVATVAYRGAAQAWGGDSWFAAAVALSTTLSLQTIVGAGLLSALRPRVLHEIRAAWRASLAPGAAGALSSALLFSALAIGPSAGAVKTVQLADVLIAWAVSHRLLRETMNGRELVGACLILGGAAGVLLG